VAAYREGSEGSDGMKRGGGSMAAWEGAYV
jgi:hypothetical protein